MAHLPVSRELTHADAVVHHLAAWRGRVMTACPLCGESSCGGSLCTLCTGLVSDTFRSVPLRCCRCCLALDPDGLDVTTWAQGHCADCAELQPAFQHVIAAFDYDAPGDLLIHRFKVERRFSLAPVLGGLLADAVQRSWPGLPSDLILVPVPASRKAILRRGFNPAADIARILQRRLQRPCRPALLRRVRDGHKQATLSRDQRMISIFRLYETCARVQGAQIAIVDDVLTTGSTMHHIARLFRRAGAQAVYGMVLARTPRSSRGGF